MYICPVCAYEQLSHPPTDFTICPCCGTEFENHTYYSTPEELRAKWVANGMQWYSHVRPTPKNWNPITQLITAGFGSSLAIPIGSTTTTNQVSIIMSPKTFWSRADLDKYTIQAA